VDETPVRNARDLARKIGGLPPGTTVKLALIRKGTDKTVSLTLGELPSMREARAERRDRDRDYDYRRGRDRDERSDRRRDRDERRGGERDYDRSEGPRLGLSLAPAGNEPGVVVAEVDPTGPAADFGFKPGDVILDVAGKTVDTPADVRKALGEARAQGKRSVLLRIKTEQGTRFVAIPLERA
jgi:serine protease Do